MYVNVLIYLCLARLRLCIATFHSNFTSRRYENFLMFRSIGSNAGTAQSLVSNPFTSLHESIISFLPVYEHQTLEVNED